MIIIDNDGIKFNVAGQSFIFDIVSFPIIFGKFWEQWMQKHIKTIAEKNSGIILDIGANIGTHTLYMSKFRQTWAFEPQKKTFEILKKNVESNNLINKVTCYNLGLSNINGNLNMAMANPFNNGGTGISENGWGEKIEVKKLDDIWINNNKPKISFIKIDVEGHEISVFKGAEKLLSTVSPIILFEDHTGENGEYLQKNFGYSVKKISKNNDFIGFVKRDEHFSNLVNYSLNFSRQEIIIILLVLIIYYRKYLSQLLVS